MKRRLCFFVIVVSLVGSLTGLTAQTRRTVGTTREDQHPATSTSTPPRGEQRAPDPAPPPQPPQQPTGPAHPTRPTGGVLIEVAPPPVIFEPVVPGALPAKESAPLWPVAGTEILDRVGDPGNAGYNFEDEQVVSFNDDDMDVYYESEDSLLCVADDSDIEDLGPAKSVREDLRVDRDGWEVDKAVEVQPGHSYAIWCWDGQVVRLYVQKVLDDAVVFDWMPARSIERIDAKSPIFGR
jgi:hypothetical protein